MKAPAPAAAPVTEVGVVVARPKKVAIVQEFPGRLNAYRVAEVRARVAGILTKRLFVEGSDVTEGQTLALIDPKPYQAALDSALAAEAKAEANQRQVEAQAGRYKELLPIHAVSQQDYDSVVASVDSGKADIASAKANVDTARINLGYATLTAPIAGRVGRDMVTEGALVGQGDATEVTTVTQLDPIYFDFTESSSELLELRRKVDSGQLKSVEAGTALVTIVLEDGSTYSPGGKLLFSDVTVDQSTGMVTLRAEVPNPRKVLLPGMFARGRLEQAVEEHALTVPVRGVQHGADGGAYVMIVDAQDKVEQRAVELGSLQGNEWVVRSGLSDGDRIIVEGLQKIAPGAPVKAVPFQPAATPTPHS